MPIVKAMNERRKVVITTAPRKRSAQGQPVRKDSRGQLEVNVVFTDARATAGALRYAMSLARDLKVSIRLRAAIIVPWQLPLDEPPVSVAFTEQLLSDLVSEFDGESCALAVNLYLCRNWRETLLEILDPNSPVVIGSSKRWWFAAENRLARALRRKGYRVLVAGAEGNSHGEDGRAGAGPEMR